MKKVLRILLILSILSLSGCDFVRKAAGRPTTAELEVMAREQECRRKTVQDSIQAAVSRSVQSELERVDSLRTASFFNGAGVRSSYTTSFGNPVDPLPFIYNIVVGVYSVEDKVWMHIDKLQNCGFTPYPIRLKNGFCAVCVSGTDDREKAVELLNAGKSRGVCPSGTWILIRK